MALAATSAFRVVDLTQELSPRTPAWPGRPPLRASPYEEHETDGSYSRRLELDEHLGTHIDAPAHFHAGGATADQLSAQHLVAELAVIDARTSCREATLLVTADAVTAHERHHGRIPRGAVAVAWTGWDRHVADPCRYVGNPPAFPGFSLDAAEALLRRRINGLGIDTPGIDPGASAEFAVHRRTLSAGVYHLEGLTSLGAVPARGALIVVGALKLEGGSGAPARVFALLP